MLSHRRDLIQYKPIVLGGNFTCENNNLWVFEVVEFESFTWTNVIISSNFLPVRFKFNISIVELCQTVMKALLELSLKEETKSKQEHLKELDKVKIFVWYETVYPDQKFGNNNWWKYSIITLTRI